MSTSDQSWQADFGVDTRLPPNFFERTDQITTLTPQSHLLRRAFGLLEVDGVLYAQNSPLVYFRVLDKDQPEKLAHLHRQFWNHGGAAVLVVVTPTVTHIYSGMVRPEFGRGSSNASLVATLSRVSTELKQFVTSVESGAFFHHHRKSFDPSRRVDRDLLGSLKNARERLGEISKKRVPSDALDALLCRLVFTSYLFDRGVIGQDYLAALGLRDSTNLRDLLSLQPISRAKDALYQLFDQLGLDFNGDLFNDDLIAEKRLIAVDHVRVIRDFFNGTDPKTGQQSFWPYDFGIIPIETISAIYERFLKPDDKARGAFYTPRFLAEVVIDAALMGQDKLLGRTFLDPACGSGIFLVGLFNRLAEEWTQANPRARNDQRSRELMRLLQESLFGVDTSRTACRIAAFSLYLAYLDQLTPPDIRELQAKGHALPRLVSQPNSRSEPANIWNVDFFQTEIDLPTNVGCMIGNPPWGSLAQSETAAGQWCRTNNKEIPDNQIATAFVWKAVEHVSDDGAVCFVLPHGTLFNHGSKAIRFQRDWVTQHRVDRVINLADLRLLLFEDAIHPALIVSYAKHPPSVDHSIDYWCPKADWTVTQAEVLTVSTLDRGQVRQGDLVRNLDSNDAPQIWKHRFWGTERDVRLIDRLATLPRLRDTVRQIRERDSNKRWMIAEGFQPLGENDDPSRARNLELPSRHFIPATSKAIDLLLLDDDCEELDDIRLKVRRGSLEMAAVFAAPHVLVSKGFGRVAFADFDVSFQHALRGISGPKEDSSLLAFLAGYLSSSVARYFLFHTSSNWAIYRPEVHVEELLSVPFVLPDQHPDPERAKGIVDTVAKRMNAAKSVIQKNMLARKAEVDTATAEIEVLVREYFDVLPKEAILIDDTMNVIVPSIQPSYRKMPVPTVASANQNTLSRYREMVCSQLNQWGNRNGRTVSGTMFWSVSTGTAVAKFRLANPGFGEDSDNGEQVITILDELRRLLVTKSSSLELSRGLLVFDKDCLFVVKPLGNRFWTETAALNDADEIAASILMDQLPGQ